MTISSEKFREALRLFPAGVTIVTINSPGQEKPHGLTVSAFSSISPEPPLIMIAIDHRSLGHEMLEAEGAVFAVNILSQEMSELSNRFAWIKDEDRFAVGDWGTAVTGAPILQNALAWLDCTIHNRYEAGTPHHLHWQSGGCRHARWREISAALLESGLSLPQNQRRILAD